MKCDFCEKELPIVGAFNGLSDDDLTAFIDRTREAVPNGTLFLDIDEGTVTQFFRPKSVSKLDGYKCLCERCANKIDAYTDKLLESLKDLELKLSRNTARNAINAHRGRSVPPYLIVFDLDIPAHPAAQIFKQTSGLYRLCNELEGDAVSMMLKRMEG